MFRKRRKIKATFSRCTRCVHSDVCFYLFKVSNCLHYFIKEDKK